MEEETICESTSSPATPSNRADVSPPYLPPCMVCGKMSSGFHSGAYTCEACKAFFRRCPRRKKRYRCRFSDSSKIGSCEIGPGQDTSCSFCRYRKCLSVGMSCAASKVGRYTLQKKTEIILELKKMNTLKSRSQEETVLTLCSSSGKEISHTSTGQMPSPDLEEMIKTIVKGHDANIHRFLYSAEEAEQLQKEFLESYTIKLKMFGSLPFLPDKQYEEIYQITGIDVDNRQTMMRQVASYMEEIIGRLVKFVKTIPGFTDLAIDDQANLVKYSRFELSFLEGFHGYNSKLEVAITPTGTCFHLDDCSRLYDLKFANALFDFAQRLKTLNLVPEELVILKAVCVLFSDRCKLQDRDKVEEMQWKLVRCLLYLLKRNHQKETGLFARVIDRLTAMRELTELHEKSVTGLHLSPVIQEHPLLTEMLSI